jgi:short-subunit dehydrogenase
MFAKKRNVGAALAKLLASRGASVVAIETMKSRLEDVVGSLEDDGTWSYQAMTYSIPRHRRH